jgi:carbon storage regulator
MLVLTRRETESLRIGDEVTVTVIAIRHGQVRIGIAAPKSVPVHREEVYVRIHDENALCAARDV